MSRLVVYALVACLAWKLLTGRWPWQKRVTARGFALAQARALLGVGEGASREQVIEAHRRLLGEVHPDRGGTNEQVHAANDARDLLLAAAERGPQAG